MYRLTFAALSAATAYAAGGDYTYDQNGADWGETYNLCANGDEQSPIDLFTEGTDGSSDMELNGYGYKDFSIEVGNDSGLDRSQAKVFSPVADGEFHLNFADGSKSVFEVAQFHFHAPSEHSVNGNLYDLEIHFVHLYADTDGALGAVIGVFFDREEGGNYNNDFLEAFWGDGDYVDVNVASFLSNVDFSEYWNYPGSLTTPPCTQGIKWTVIKEVQPISDEQLKKFTSLWADDPNFASGKGNNRVVQQLKDRTLMWKSALSGLSATAITMAASIAYLAF